ncbi:MAG: alpha-L-fucosidase [Planctomycetes bacterium]|nr:alpha-L-fucosidase [Planctomycetota bacterium]
MRTTTALALTLTALLGACDAAPSTPQLPNVAASAQDQRMAWWRDARFGMFLHWGLYAIPAGEWNGNKDYGEWIRTSAEIPLETYDQLQPKWNPTDFDADAWAEMAAAAGMKYVVITSKHHDGFCLWDSAVTDWDVAGSPNQRDILAELSTACRKHGIKFCTYHSIMDWHHPDYLPRRTWEKDRSTEGADFERFEQYLHAQVTEIITRYHPAVMWFDGEWENTWTHERGVKLFELCRRLAPEMIVNNRVDVHRQGMQGFSGSSEAVGDFDTPEQEIPATGLPGVDWESCMTMNRHWGWNQADTVWKSPETLIRNLIDIASKGGNYLLNVGPRADGTFPPNAVERLAAIADWMKQNSEAIHGTTASVFDALPWGRCTVKAGDDFSALYLHVFDWPKDGQLLLPGLGNQVIEARTLGGAPQAVAAVPSQEGVMLVVPQQPSDPIATVIEVRIEGRPIVYRTPSITAESERFVRGLDVTIATPAADAELRYTSDGSEPTAASPRVQGPVHVADTCTVRAAMFHDGRRRSEVASRTFTRVEPLPPVEVQPSGDGLVLQQAAVDWNTIPDERPELMTKGMLVPQVALPKGVGEHVALSFSGFVDVAASELYRFALSSDDGSKLWIDGKVVVDNDGLHGATEQRGEVALAKGLHQLEVVWFNATGGAELRLKWAAPGQPFAELPAAALKH